MTALRQEVKRVIMASASPEEMSRTIDVLLCFFAASHIEDAIASLQNDQESNENPGKQNQ